MVQDVVDVLALRSVVSKSRIVRLLRGFRQRNVDDTAVPFGQCRDDTTGRGIPPVGGMRRIGHVLAGHVRHDHIPPLIRLQSTVRREVDLGGVPIRRFYEWHLADLPPHGYVRLRLHVEGWEYGYFPAVRERERGGEGVMRDD